jgi:putative redox protein
MEEIAPRSVTLVREAEGVYVATNSKGGQIRFGHNVPDGFGSVELLLAALAGCSGTDVDVVTSRRAEPTRFEVTVTADKVSGDAGNALRNIVATFDLEFPEGEDGDKARARIEPTLRAAHDRTCTVSRTIENAVPVTLRVAT